MVGVYWDKRNQKWKAMGRIYNTSLYLGNYQTEEEAGCAVQAFMDRVTGTDNKMLAWLHELYPSYEQDAFLPIVLNALHLYINSSSDKMPIPFVADYVKAHYSQIANTTMEQINEAKRIISRLPSYITDWVFGGLSYNSVPNHPQYGTMRLRFRQAFPAPFPLDT